MFQLKSIIYFNIISFILAQNQSSLPEGHTGNELVIEPPRLILRSTDSEKFFHCHSRGTINKQQQRKKLMASIENPIITLPAFVLRTEQINATTMRIRIRPNSFIGINRIHCHWNNNLTYGQTADLIIGENPGVIQLTEHCLAYDRRYVQCIIRAPIIARAFQNGFPRLFTFSEMNTEPFSYNSPAILVDINNRSELVFHFEPRDRNNIPKQTSMIANITLSQFDSSVYRFNIEPLHTTNVDFQIENLSAKRFTIRIHHDNTGTVSQRLCSGQITQVDEQIGLTTVQDISETIEQKILIDRLRPLLQYEVCLRCFYEQTDQSFKEQKCIRLQTTKRDIWSFSFGIKIAVAVLIAIVVAVSFILIVRNENYCPNNKPTIRRLSNLSTPPKIQFSYDIQPHEHRYVTEPGQSNEDLSLMSEDCQQSSVEDHALDSGRYRLMDDLLQDLTDENKVSPDTIDLTRQGTTQ